MNLLDSYFKKPVFWDYFVASLISFIIWKLYYNSIIKLPDESNFTSITSDIANIGLTSTGFILTLLTVLITFKSSSRITKKNISKAETIFEMFFVSGLYFETVKHLKNCIKSLIFISLLGFLLKIFLNNYFKYLLFFYNIIGIAIVIFTLWRCLLILGKILEMQEKE